MKRPNVHDFMIDWIKMPLTTLGMKLQLLDLAGVEPETVQAALQDHAALTKYITTLLSMLREDEELWKTERRERSRPPRVLIAAHDPVLLKIYRDYLTERGMWVYTVTAGDMAVNAARILDCDCAVLDIQMPGVGLSPLPMGGREVCRHLREFTEIPVIFLSSTLYRWQAGVDEIMGVGDVYMEKPCGSETLYHQILYCLGQTRKSPEVL